MLHCSCSSTGREDANNMRLNYIKVRATILSENTYCGEKMNLFHAVSQLGGKHLLSGQNKSASKLWHQQYQ